MSKIIKHIVEEVEEGTVEIIKAPFNIVGGIFDWLSGD
jgi:hypothetical protein